MAENNNPPNNSLGNFPTGSNQDPAPKIDFNKEFDAALSNSRSEVVRGQNDQLRRENNRGLVPNDLPEPINSAVRNK